jgi:hypothetical protein
MNKVATIILLLACVGVGSASQVDHLDMTIHTIPHREQRYDTVGDYFEQNGVIHFRISQLPDWRYEFLVALHEQIEWALCQQAGITIEQIDAFDLTWKPHDGIEEPGDDPRAPYHRQHQIATKHERQMARQLGVNWDRYEKALETLVRR